MLVSTSLLVLAFSTWRLVSSICHDESVRRISDLGVIDLIPGDRFGYAMAAIGDLDNDGIGDVAIGSPGSGAIYIVFLLTDGAIKHHVRIESQDANETEFGRAIGAVGDLDGDLIPEIAVSGYTGNNTGVVNILFMQRDGTVKSQQRLSETEGGLDIPPYHGEDGDRFGESLSGLQDLDKDGVPDLAVGASFDDNIGKHSGAVYILYLHRNGTVKSYAKISGTEGGFDRGEGGVEGGVPVPLLHQWDMFGSSVANVGDMDGDDINDLVIGAPGDGMNKLK